MDKRYQNSEQMLQRALKSIPLGTQTFSKSKIQYPYGVSPYFIQKGKGSYVWDVDGNKYIDFVNGLCPIILGYNDIDVVSAVRKQLKEGTIFSLSHPIEIDVAEKIIDMVPCAEMVRFGKNGSDATSGAIRLARAYTKRERVAVCGYHGWHDWYIGSTTRNLGVPKSTVNLTHKFNYNDINSLFNVFKKYPNQISAVIMEPMNIQWPKNNFLLEVKELTHFRFSEGGAQELFGVVPDLVTLGKGMANGYPLSAIAGKASIMKLLAEVFYSSTFGGETLSLAASLATMNKIQQQSVVGFVKKQGEKVVNGLNKLIEKYELSLVFDVAGHPSWSFLIIKDFEKYSNWQIKTLFLQEMFKKGILTFGTHVMSFAHKDKDIEYLLNSYDEIFVLIKKVLKDKSLDKYLKCKPLEPLFKVR